MTPLPIFITALALIFLATVLRGIDGLIGSVVLIALTLLISFIVYIT